MRRALAAAVLTIAGVAAFSIAPTQQDFGSVGVMGIRALPFHVTMAPGATVDDSIYMTIVGANPQDFNVLNEDDRACATPDQNTNSGFRPGACDIGVEFRPTSIGPKTARLQVRDRHGTIVTANLKGLGVAPICEMKVVFCNYAHLYTGTFSWQEDLNGPYGQNRKSVTVNVVNGVATCDGSETDVSISVQGAQRYTTTEVGSIKGPGLIAIEFEQDTRLGLVYRVSAACPSPQWQASRNMPSRPAEMGSSYAEESYRQPTKLVGDNLNGSRSVAHPASDSPNGVTGTMNVSWKMTRS